MNIPQINLEQFYSEHKKLIYERAKRYSTTIDSPIEELVSIGNSVFMDALRTWNPAKASFATWFYRLLNQSFSKTVRQKHTRRNLEYNFAVRKPVYSGGNIWRRIHFRELLDKMTKEARAVAEIILEGPSEVLGLSGCESPKKVRGVLFRYLRKKNWQEREIWGAFREIKEVLEAM